MDEKIERIQELIHLANDCGFKSVPVNVLQAILDGKNGAWQIETDDGPQWLDY